MTDNLNKLNQITPSRRQVGKIAFATAGVTAVGSSVAANAAASDIRYVSTAYRNQDAQKLLDLINAYRAQNGLAAVKHSATIASVMDAEATRQFNAGYYSHGTEFLYNSKVRGYSFVREVIALSYNDDISQLLDFWKSSYAHRVAILAPEANTIGIGLCYGKGTSLPWRILGNVGIYRYDGNNGPGDIQASIVGSTDSADNSSTSTNTLAYPVVNGIASRFYAEGGLDTFGQPTMAERGGLANGGVYQEFVKDGRKRTIVWSPFTGAHSVYEPGAVANVWRNNGGEASIGYPIMKETVLGEGTYQTFRNVNGSHKTIYWTASTGAQIMHDPGAIARHWTRLGGVNGLGFPSTGEYWSGVEVHQRYSSGKTIAWSSLTGATRVF